MAIPPEIVDRIIDYSHDDTKTLVACSLTARDWVPSTRLHLFTNLSLLSARQVSRFIELDSLAPYIFNHCQELSLGSNSQFGDFHPTGSQPFNGTPQSLIDEHVGHFASLHTLHFRGFRTGVKGDFLASLLGVSVKITTATFTDISFESCHDLWKILRSFPNLENVHVADLGYSHREEENLIIAPSNCYSPPIASFSLHTHCQGFVLERLAEPPYPLTHLTSLEIHHTDQQQRALDSVAAKYCNAITTLRFSAHSTVGFDIPPHIGMYNRLHTLILGKLELFAAYPLSPRLFPTLPTFAWVTATMPYVNSRLSRLVFEIVVTEKRDLNAISWEDIDASLGTREQFGNLKSVEVVFLDTIPTTITRHPDTLRPGIDLREDLMKQMPRMVERGLVRCLARGLRTLW